jgi:hypothetical protein
MSALTASLQTMRRALALAGTLLLLGLGATPARALSGTNATNPASSALAPVSTQARPSAGTGTRASGAGTSAAGAPAATNIPTTTYAPPAQSQIGTAAPEIQRAKTSALGTPNARTARRTSSSTSAAAIALAALAALLALAAAAWGIARSQAYEPHWTVSLRHAMAEAGFRASATWAEFSDWARLGR